MKTSNLVLSLGVRGTGMKRFVEGQDRSQLILLPDCLDDYVGEDNPVLIVDAFIDELDLAVLGFAGHCHGNGSVQRGSEVRPRFMRRQPHLATGRLLRL